MTTSVGFCSTFTTKLYVSDYWLEYLNMSCGTVLWWRLQLAQASSHRSLRHYVVLMLRVSGVPEGASVCWEGCVAVWSLPADCKQMIKDFLFFFCLFVFLPRIPCQWKLADQNESWNWNTILGEVCSTLGVSVPLEHFAVTIIQPLAINVQKEDSRDVSMKCAWQKFLRYPLEEREGPREQHSQFT